MKKPDYHIILYSGNIEQSKGFYRRVLEKEPVTDVAGMVEFRLGEDLILGLMPEAGIAKILKDRTPHPSEGRGVPRCELYIYVEDVASAVNNAVRAGAKLVSETAERNWGDIAGYVADPDGHIIAFAGKKV